MRGVRGVLKSVGLAAALVALWSTGCEDPVAAFTGISVDSSVVQQHSHRVTVLSRDIENPPSAGATYVTTSAGSGPHTHEVHLTLENLRDLQQRGASVSVTTSVAGSGPQAHTHVFDFVR